MAVGASASGGRRSDLRSHRRGSVAHGRVDQSHQRQAAGAGTGQVGRHQQVSGRIHDQDGFDRANPRGDWSVPSDKLHEAGPRTEPGSNFDGSFWSSHVVTLDERINRSLPLAEYVSGQPEIEASVSRDPGRGVLLPRPVRQGGGTGACGVQFKRQAAGPEHRETSRVANLLASLLDQTGRRDEALPLMRGNLEHATPLGPDDEVTLDATERLGLLLWHVGKLDEAETLLRRNADDRRRLQPNTVGLMRSTFMLSRFVRDRGGFAEAEKLASQYEHDVRGLALGPSHFENVVALINRGDLYRVQGKLDDAEKLLHHAAVEAARILGREHPTSLAAQDYYDRFLRQTNRPKDDGAGKPPPLAQLPGDVFAPRESIAPHSR